jgi:hypothetical protein
MIKETVIVEKFCDICKKKVPDFIKWTTETNMVVYEVKKHLYGAGSKTLDICKDCHEEIAKTIDRLAGA